MMFGHIDSLKAKLDEYRPLTQGELERLRKEFLINFTYNSNAIEGNTLTLRETALVLEGLTIDKKPIRDHLEVIGHSDAFRYVEQLVTDNIPLSERIIKEIHSLVLINRPFDRGKYRNIPVRIMGAYHEPPQPYLVPKLMEELCSKQSDLHVIEQATLFHLDFEGIHPFIDGNGRTGRLIMNLSLMQNGYPPINVKFTDRTLYYRAFDSYYEHDDHNPMLELVSGYVEEELKKLINILDSE